MTMCYRKTAEEKYRACKRVTVFILVCMAAFIGLTVYNLLTGSPISDSSATFVCTASCALSLNVRNMRKAQEEMNNKIMKIKEHKILRT